MARRRTHRAQLQPVPDSGIPAEIVLGPLFEVYGTPEMVARDLAGGRWGAYSVADRREVLSRWSAARRAWLEAHGFDLNDRSTWPPLIRADRGKVYSLTRMRRDTPKAAAQLLHRAGVGENWEPSAMESTYDD